MGKRLSFLYMLILLILFTNVALAQTFDETKRKAENGDAESQYQIGKMYYKGDSAQQDYTQAKIWFEKAAAQGHAGGQNGLGNMYNDQKDYAQAKSWYEKAAAQGNAGGQINLGSLYYFGKGVKQDYTQTKIWFEKAAAQGNAGGQYSLGSLYYNAKGVKQDYSQAKIWWEKAAVQGNADAQYSLGYLYGSGEGVKQDYSKAKEWYEKAAVQGNADAKSAILQCQEKNNQKNKHQSLLNKISDNLKKDAEYGNAFAQYKLGQIYAEANDRSQAMLWIEKAALQRHEEAQYHLGLIYLEGRLGVTRDWSQAKIWFEKSAAQGNSNAKIQLDNINNQKRFAELKSGAQKITTKQDAKMILEPSNDTTFIRGVPIDGFNENQLGKSYEWNGQLRTKIGDAYICGVGNDSYFAFKNIIVRDNQMTENSNITVIGKLAGEYELTFTNQLSGIKTSKRVAILTDCYIF